MDQKENPDAVDRESGSGGGDGGDGGDDYTPDRPVLVAARFVRQSWQKLRGGVSCAVKKARGTVSSPDSSLVRVEETRTRATSYIARLRREKPSAFIAGSGLAAVVLSAPFSRFVLARNTCLALAISTAVAHPELLYEPPSVTVDADGSSPEEEEEESAER